MEENSLQRNSNNISRNLGLRGIFLLPTTLSKMELKKGIIEQSWKK
jgi:hypothetical protein